MAVGDGPAHPVKVRMIDKSLHTERVGILIARRIIADRLAFRVLGHQFMAVLVDVQIAAGDLPELQDIRVGLGKLRGGCHHEFLRILIDQQAGIFPDAARRMEGRNRFPVLLPIGQLLGNFLFGTLPSLTEPGGELCGTVLAHIPVFQLFVPEQADFRAAEIACFLVKQSHNKPPLFYILFLNLCLSMSIEDIGTKVNSWPCLSRAHSGIHECRRWTDSYLPILNHTFHISTGKQDTADQDSIQFVIYAVISNVVSHKQGMNTC